MSRDHGNACLSPLRHAHARKPAGDEHREGINDDQTTGLARRALE